MPFQEVHFRTFWILWSLISWEKHALGRLRAFSLALCSSQFWLLTFVCKNVTGNPIPLKRTTKFFSLFAFLFLKLFLASNRAFGFTGCKVLRLLDVAESMILCYLLSSFFPNSEMLHFFYLPSDPVQLITRMELFVNAECLMFLKNVASHQSLNLYCLFSLIGNVLPLCDCSLFTTKVLWFPPSQLLAMKENLRGRQKLTYVEHGSVLRLSLSQSTIWLIAAVATTNRPVLHMVDWFASFYTWEL